MSDEIRLEGLGIAPGVIDTIVTLAAQSVEGVRGVGAPGLAGLVQKGSRKPASRPVDVCVAEDGSVAVTLHIQVQYGLNLREVASAVQTGVRDAVRVQVGVPVGGVDVFVDGLVFDEQ
jgi:uncharacterized alkaline shock family protein YloU